MYTHKSEQPGLISVPTAFAPVQDTLHTHANTWFRRPNGVCACFAPIVSFSCFRFSSKPSNRLSRSSNLPVSLSICVQNVVCMCLRWCEYVCDLWMYECICLFIWVYMHVCIYVCSLYAWVYVCMDACTFSRMCECTWPRHIVYRMHIHMWAFEYIGFTWQLVCISLKYVFVCMHVQCMNELFSMCLCICIYVSIYARVHKT